MGTASTTKVIKNNAGTLTELAALTTSAGAGDAQAIPALNASGYLDLTITNGKNTSAGAGDAGKLAALDSAGKLSSTMMPVGIGVDSLTLTTSEVIAAGDFVNIWNSTGAKVRKADAATSGKEAHGFVLVGAGSGASVDVFFEGTNTAATGTPTAGVVFLSASTPGQPTNTAPSASGNVVQRIGFATSSTSVNFQSNDPIVLV
jgi:hypothetical protein